MNAELHFPSLAEYRTVDRVDVSLVSSDTGTLDEYVIAASVNPVVDDLISCNAGSHATILVQLRIEPNGETSAVDPGTVVPKVRSCFLEALAGVRFPTSDLGQPGAAIRVSTRRARQ